MSEEEMLKIGNCPICENGNIPVRLFRMPNKMAVWFCDPCLEKYKSSRGRGGITTR
jgi:hypothetical protein